VYEAGPRGRALQLDPGRSVLGPGAASHRLAGRGSGGGQTVVTWQTKQMGRRGRPLPGDGICWAQLQGPPSRGSGHRKGNRRWTTAQENRWTRRKGQGRPRTFFPGCQQGCKRESAPAPHQQMRGTNEMEETRTAGGMTGRRHTAPCWVGSYLPLRMFLQEPRRGQAKRERKRHHVTLSFSQGGGPGSPGSNTRDRAKE
jgi:hypothetical protein